VLHAISELDDNVIYEVDVCLNGRSEMFSLRVAFIITGLMSVKLIKQLLLS
jgi:hypothetical protein